MTGFHHGGHGGHRVGCRGRGFNNAKFSILAANSIAELGTLFGPPRQDELVFDDTQATAYRARVKIAITTGAHLDPAKQFSLSSTVAAVALRADASDSIATNPFPSGP